MIRFLLVLALIPFSQFLKAQEIEVYLNPVDCHSCMTEIDKVIKYSSESKMTIVSNKENSYLIQEILKKYVSNLPSCHYDFIENDSLYNINMSKVDHRSFIKVLFKGKFLASFIIKSLYTKGYNKKLEEVLVSLKHPFLNVDLKYPIYYPKITSTGFYAVNKPLERLEYYHRADTTIVMDQIDYDEIMELSLQFLYSGQALENIKKYTQEFYSSYVSLGPGGSVYGDTLMISYSFGTLVDTVNYQKNLIFGIISVYDGKIVDIDVPFNQDMSTLKYWPSGHALVKHNGQVLVYKQLEGVATNFLDRNAKFGYFNDSGKIISVPMIFDTSLYYSLRCGPNFQGCTFQSGKYLANQRSFLELNNLDEQSTFKIPWDSNVINKHYPRHKDTCFAFAVLGFTHDDNSFNFLIRDQTKNGSRFALLSYVQGETMYRYLTMLNDYKFAAIFGSSLIVGFNRSEIKWEPVTLF